MPLIISTSDKAEPSFYSGSIVISRILGYNLRELSIEEDPNKVLKDLTQGNELAKLNGDAAMLHYSGLSWLEAVGFWKLPVILMTSVSEAGKIPGSASAYVCLCKSFSVPLLGIVQLGGDWNFKERKLDNLPWCGFIPNELLVENFVLESSTHEHFLLMKDMAKIIKQRITSLTLYNS